MTRFDVVEADIAQLRSALEQGRVTSEELVDAYLARIDAYDKNGPRLNALVVMNPNARDEARASDERRSRGETLGPLDGIPYTAKDSYLVRGLTAAAGSPAFAHLVAQRDAFTIERLRAAGGVLIGLTNMPPMANGGMQRGVYGRAESPYNGDFLTTAFGSGSSNGSGTATAASFAAFGLGEETWSSGRAPASNNALCAYTPSRGVISVRGNWPLVPTMDVVVPHTRTMADLLEVLDVIVADDPETRGDFWRAQPWVEIPRHRRCGPSPSRWRLPTPPRHGSAGGAAIRRSAHVPRTRTPMPGPASTRVSAARPGSASRPARRSSISVRAATADLEAAGAEVVVVDFPVVSNYEGDRAGAPTIRTAVLSAGVPRSRDPGSLGVVVGRLPARERRSGAAPARRRRRLADLRPPGGALPDRAEGFDDDITAYPGFIREHPIASFLEIPHIEEGLRGLEQTRRVDLEEWMDGLGLDAVIFPAVADVGPADMDVNEASADLGWRNGVWVANGNLVPAPRNSDGHRADGHDGRHRDAGRPHLRRPRLRRQRAAAPRRRVRGDRHAAHHTATNAAPALIRVIRRAGMG